MQTNTTACVLAIVSALLAVFFINGCSEQSPVRIGLVAGLSGGNADLGQAGRNGALLAVEQVNARGGLNGNQALELVIRDDANDKIKAAAATENLIQEGVVAIIGPYTTAMSEAVLNVAGPKQMLVLSPTASAASLSGRDDIFFRLNSSTTDNAQQYAGYIIGKRGYTRISLVVDERNATFARDWINAFEKNAQTLGVGPVGQVWYASGNISDFDALVDQILTQQPEVALLVANAVDVARIAQQLRKKEHQMKLFAAEWAGTQQLIELGGKAVDGLEVLHVYDLFGQQQAYLDFVRAYTKRFNSSPSYSSVLSYEAVQVVIQAMQRQQSGQSLKTAILKNGPYQGLQQMVEFNDFGDSHRQAHFVSIDKTTFVRSPNQ